MSNKTQLQTNNTALDALITRVNAAKDTAASLSEAGGGSGGGSVETCTVTINVNQPLVLYEYAVIIKESDGIISVINDVYRQGNTVTIPNIVKGSLILIKTNNPVIPAWSFSNSADVSIIHSGYFDSSTWFFQIAQTASNNITITIFDND